jgi:hypothetical protein
VLELRRRCWLGGRAARRCGGSACTTSSSSPRQKVRSTHGPPGRRARRGSEEPELRRTTGLFSIQRQGESVSRASRRHLAPRRPRRPALDLVLLSAASPPIRLSCSRAGRARRERASAMAWRRRPCTGAPAPPKRTRGATANHRMGAPYTPAGEGAGGEKWGGGVNSGRGGVGALLDFVFFSEPLLFE